MDAITKLYEGMDADVDAEVTADLVGDYLFTDAEFVRKLSTEHRNLFQKIFDEIKYLCKVATAGSKEARQLEKAKKAFEDAYRESGKAQKNTAEDGGVKYSMTTSSASGMGVDSYSEEQYNSFGWASYNDVITAQEREILFSRYADFKHNRDKYPVTRGGEAVMHSSECPDVIMYVKGTIDHPTVTRIVRIKADDSADVYAIQERIVANEFEQKPFPYDAITDYYGEEYLEFHRKRDYASFRQYQDAIREGRGGQESNPVGEELQDGKGSNRGGRASNQANSGISAGNVTEQKTSSSDGVFFDATTHHSISESNNNGRVDDIAPAIGSYNVYGKDIALEDLPIRDDVAPTSNVKKELHEDGEPAIMTSEASENTLTYDEEDALLAYKSGGSYTINAKLLDGDALSSYEKKIVDGLDRALKKLPVHQGKVYRNIAFDGFGDQEAVNELLKGYVVGEVVEHKPYTSTSSDPNGYPVNGEFVVHYEIESTGGRDMQGYGNNMESEVLIPRNAEFFVNDIRYDESGTPTIYLTEMTNGGQTNDAGRSGKDIGRKGIYAGGDRATVSRDVPGGQNVRLRETAPSDMQRLPPSDSAVGDVRSVSEQDTARSVGYGSVRGVRTDTGRDTAEPIDPIRETPSNDGVFFDAKAKPIKTVKERLSAKLQNYQTELATNLQQRSKSLALFNKKIERWKYLHSAILNVLT